VLNTLEHIIAGGCFGLEKLENFSG